MSNQVMHPALDQLISLDLIPNEIEALKDALLSVFDEIFVKDLIFNVNYRGEAGFYTLTLTTYNSIGVGIPIADDLKLVLNPTNVGTTEIPVRFDYIWPIIKYIQDFNFDTFENTGISIFNILFQLTEITKGQLLLDAITVFYPDTDGINDFINDFNSLYNQDITAITNPDAAQLSIVNQLAKDIEGQNFDILLVIFEMLIDPDTEDPMSRIKLLFERYFDDIEANFKESLTLHFNVYIDEISAGLQFSHKWLVPVYTGSEPVQGLEIDDPLPESYFSVLKFNTGNLGYSSKNGFEFNQVNSFELNRSMIGNTGLIVEFDGLKVDLSRDSNIPEADADGRPSGFMGAYAGYVSVTLPKKWFNNVDNTTLRIAGYNLLVGTGGVSGTIALETVGGQPNNGATYMSMNIGNWEVGFNYFDLTFKQNVITQSTISGRLKIPKLKDAQNNDALIYLNGHLNEAGDFNLTASEPEGIPFTLFNFITFNFLTLELGRENDKFYIGTSCQIWFENQIMSKLIGDQIIEIPRLRVYDNGTIEIVGGNGFIPLNISLNLGPIEMAVTGVHYGATQLEYQGNMRKYNYWGFDGAISIDPLGIDVRGDGIKYYYTTDNDEHNDNGDSFIHIKTLEIDLVIPGTASPESAIAIIHGMVSIPDPGESPEYIGEISLKLPKAKIAGGAAMRLQPRHPAFLIDAYIDLPAPIPIGPLGIYGFRGLLGFRYVAEKEAVGLVSGQDTWYDYYVYPPKGIHVSKFSGPERTADYTAPFSLGAGAVLGTSFDSGTVLSVRAMLLLSLPTLFMVEGKASILSARLGLDDNREPPFFAFVAWGDNSIEMGMGADFKVPSSNGWILDLYAEVQAGFFFNSPSAWYVNFGTKQNPISARVLTIVTAQTYLMLSAQGIEAGARVHFELRKRFGPAKVYLYAYIEVGGYISFERPQIGGYIAAGGGIDVDIWIIGISLSLDTIFSAEAAKPFLIYAKIRFRACVKILFAKVCKSFTVKLKWEKNKQVDRTPVPSLPFFGSVNRTSELVKGIHMLTNEAFDLNFLGMSAPPSAGQITKVIPLDTYIEFKVEKGLIPGEVSGKIGGYTFAPENYVDLIPPQKVVRGGHELRQVKHKYSIEDIEIKAWNGSSWQDYHPFEAVVEPDMRPDVSHLRWGYWQIKEKQYDTIRLLATTPFTYMEAGEPGWHIPELYGITPSVLYCMEMLETEDCSNVLNKDLGIRYYPPLQYVGHFINGAYYTLSNISGYEFIDGNVIIIDNEYMEVTNVANVHGFARSLSFNNYNNMIIILPEASVKVKLRLTTAAQGVTIKYYKSVIDDTTSIVHYELVHQHYKTAVQLNSVVEYENEEETITKVIIEPDAPDMAAIMAILEQIAQLFEITYDEATGEVSISEPLDAELYEQLLEELELLKQQGCSDSECQSDPIWCELYEQLLNIYESCFSYPVINIEEVQETISCFEAFNKLLIEFNTNHPGYNIFTYLDLIYPAFVQKLNYLKWLLSQVGSTEEEIIMEYYQLRDYAWDIINIIKDLGQCDCKDQRACTTSLQQICWLTLEKHEWNETIPGSEAIEEEFNDMTEALEKLIQPVWRPNTAYYIKYMLKDEVDNGQSNPGIYDYYYGFKTVGPLGHYHKNPASGYLPQGATADEYPLTSLRSYIDYNRSFPNADGNLLKAKPLFYGNEQCVISIYFKKPLTYHMFQSWYPYLNMPELEGALHIAIKDPVTDVIVPYPLPVDYQEETVPMPNEDGYVWEGDEDPLLPPHIQVINNMIENGELPCEIVLGDAIVPASSLYKITLTNLKPQKLYTALLYNAFEVSNENVVSESVHEFVFQTSRYLSFESQVESYLITDEESQTERQAVYDYLLNLNSTAINKAKDIIFNPLDQTDDPLGIKYQHLFDRVIEGVFEMPPTDPPVRTEFHKIVNLNSGDVVALLIKNPEPFNIPKIPLDLAGDMIAVIQSNETVDDTFKVLYSSDYSQALVMHETGKIIAEKLHFRFEYYTWNGSEYGVTDQVLVKNISINE